MMHKRYIISDYGNDKYEIIDTIKKGPSVQIFKGTREELEGWIHNHLDKCNEIEDCSSYGFII